MPVDLSASIYSQYLRAYKAAVEAERSGKTKEAASLYHQAAEFMRNYAGYALDPAVKQNRVAKAELLEKNARLLLKLPEGSVPKSPAVKKGNEKKGRSPANAEDEDEFEAQIRQLITRTTTTWDDVAGMQDTKDAIKSAYARALAKKPPEVEIDISRGILLVGPPGTGKTLLAAATAGSLDATFFSAKASDMLSKWFGESSQKVSALFKVARKMAPSVIFIDEIEALALSRNENISSANLQVVSTLLAELDGLKFKDSDQFVLTMGATNVPELLDEGILRRFPRRIYIPPPDGELRRAILEIHLTRKGFQSQFPLESLAERTEGYTGDEIRELCSNACERMIRRMNPDLMKIVDQGMQAVRNYTIKTDTIQTEEFDGAFEQVRPLTSPAMVKKFEKWASEH